MTSLFEPLFVPLSMKHPISFDNFVLRLPLVVLLLLFEKNKVSKCDAHERRRAE